MATVFFHTFQSNGPWLISSLVQSRKKKKGKIGNPARTAIHVSENVRILRKLNNNAIDESSNKFYKYGG